MNTLAILFALLALAGCVQTLVAGRALGRLATTPAPTLPALPVSLLKPLHGAEAGLAANLAASFAQDHAAPFEVLLAVADPADAAVPLARAAMAASATPARLLAGGGVLGANRKVSQLVHLAASAAHPVLVVADADMACPPGWLTAVCAPLADPGCGLVTCLYAAAPGDASPWSRLAALGINWHFLPNAALGESLGQARGCYGATMALRAETLDRLGGFAPLLDVLADDNALGMAVRGLGLRVEVSPVLPVHVMAEAGFMALWAHELRWARTTRRLNPWGHLGLALAHPLPWALGAAAFSAWGLPVLALALATRWHMVRGVDAALGLPHRPVWLPIRDLLSAAIWATAFLPGSVAWQGRRFSVFAAGRMSEAAQRPRGS